MRAQAFFCMPHHGDGLGAGANDSGARSTLKASVGMQRGDCGHGGVEALGERRLGPLTGGGSGPQSAAWTWRERARGRSDRVGMVPAAALRWGLMWSLITTTSIVISTGKSLVPASEGEGYRGGRGKSAAGGGR